MARPQSMQIHANTALFYQTRLYRSLAFIECPIRSLLNKELADISKIQNDFGSLHDALAHELLA